MRSPAPRRPHRLCRGLRAAARPRGCRGRGRRRGRGRLRGAVVGGTGHRRGHGRLGRRLQRHPPVDEAREHGPGHDEGRHRDDQPEEQGGAEVGLERVDGDQRTGVRRHQPVQHRQAGQRGNAHLHHRDAGAPGHHDDDRHEQHHPDLEEQRQPEDGRDERHDPRQGALVALADEPADDLVGPAGVGQQLADHRPEGDEQPDTAGRRPEAVGERRDDLVRRHRRDRTEHGSAQDEGEERVHLEARDEHDDDGDGQCRGKQQLSVAGIRGVGERSRRQRPGEVESQ